MDINPISSVALDRVARFDKYYTVFLFSFEAVVILFKTYQLPYTPVIQFRQAVILLLLLFISLGKNDLLIRGNKTQSAWLILLGVLGSILAAAGVAFFMLLQFYVLLGEVLLNAVLLGALVFEVLYGVKVIFSFKNEEKQA